MKSYAKKFNGIRLNKSKCLTLVKTNTFVYLHYYRTITKLNGQKRCFKKITREISNVKGLAYFDVDQSY